ncbi:MAG: hypothetical protein H0X24_23360 [Ktedonobacterales bacterium]|nr:hypothetical protein [Ktedonobacterales bacterium]
MMQSLSTFPAPFRQTESVVPVPRHNVRRQMHDLRSALAEGWELVQPIFARPLWSALDDDQTALNFVLQRDRATRLLTLPATPTVRRFVRQRAWQVKA